MFMATGSVPGSITVTVLDPDRVRFRINVADRSLDATLDVPRDMAREFAQQIINEIDNEGQS